MPLTFDASQAAITVVCSLLSGGGEFAFLSTRAKAKADAPAQFAEALTAAAKVLIEGYEQRCKDLESTVAGSPLTLERTNSGEDRGGPLYGQFRAWAAPIIEQTLAERAAA